MSVRQPLVIRTLLDLKVAIAHTSRYPEFAIDIETDGLNPRTNSLSWVGLGTYGQVFLIPIQHPRGRLLREERLTKTGKPSKAKNPPVVNRYFGSPGVQLMPDVVIRELEPLLFGRQVKIGHNVKFDLLSLSKYYDNTIPPGPYLDTLVMQHIVDENRRTYTLKDTALDFLRIPPARRPGYYPNLGKNIAEHPIDAVARYLARDVRYVWLMWRWLAEQIDGQGLREVLQLEMDLYSVIMGMESVGAQVDPAHLDVLDTALTEEIETIEQRAWTVSKVKVPFPLTNTNIKRDLLFGPKSAGGQGLKPLARTKVRMDPVLNQATLEHYADRNELARLFLDWSEKQKLLSTYVHGLQQRMVDGKVHTSFTQHGTVTGRLCVDPNTLVEMPRDLTKYPDGMPLCKIKPGDWVYSFDWRKNLCLRQVKWVGPTKVAETVVVEILDKHTGKHTTLRCSADHLVRMYDGDWRPAGKLRPGQRLMGMVRRGVDEGYAKFFPSSKNRARDDATTGGKVREHRWVMAQMMGRRNIPTKWSVHHRDENTLNNHPDNLEVLTTGAHIRAHKRVPDDLILQMLDGEVEVSVHPKTFRRRCAEAGLLPLYYERRWTQGAWRQYHRENHTVLSVAPGPVMQLWDLEVDDTHTFIGADVALHNSSRDPNLQNIPRDSEIRGLFVAPPGYSLVVADYDQIELRVLAHFSRDDRMRGIFDRGEDIHAGTIAAVLGKSIELVTPDERQGGKGINFAVSYGAGPQKVAAMGGVSLEEGRLFMDRYYARFSNIRPWKMHALAVARRRGNPQHPYKEPPFATTLLGRRRRLPDLFSRDNELCRRAERQAINHIVQGTAAEIMKIAMIRVHRAFKDTPFTLLLTVHDELVSLCPAGMEEEAKATVVSAMSGITLAGKPIIDVPLVISCGTATRWSDAKG